MNFSSALKYLREGERLSRLYWPSGQWVTLFENECILLHARKSWGTWKPKQDDILAIDWVLYKPIGAKHGQLSLDTKERHDIVVMPAAVRETLGGAA